MEPFVMLTISVANRAREAQDHYTMIAEWDPTMAKNPFGLIHSIIIADVYETFSTINTIYDGGRYHADLKGPR